MSHFFYPHTPSLLLQAILYPTLTLSVFSQSHFVQTQMSLYSVIQKASPQISPKSKNSEMTRITNIQHTSKLSFGLSNEAIIWVGISLGLCELIWQASCLSRCWFYTFYSGRKQLVQVKTFHPFFLDPERMDTDRHNSILMPQLCRAQFHGKYQRNCTLKCTVTIKGKHNKGEKGQANRKDFPLITL